MTQIGCWSLYYERMSSFNTSDCPNVECAQMFDDVPSGSIIGFW